MSTFHQGKNVNINIQMKAPVAAIHLIVILLKRRKENCPDSSFICLWACANGWAMQQFNTIDTNKWEAYSLPKLFLNEEPGEMIKKKNVDVSTMRTWKLPLYRLVLPLESLLPSIASLFSWQLMQRNGPSHGCCFLGTDGIPWIEMPSSGFNSTWQIAHMKSLNRLRIG